MKMAMTPERLKRVMVVTIDYTDEWGSHKHISVGSPYDHKKKISCPACIAQHESLRDELCKKYDWAVWPESLKGALINED